MTIYSLSINRVLVVLLCSLMIQSCTDGDEYCKECDANASCAEVDGHFICVCDTGFEGDGVNCLNVDECQNGTHNCDVNSTCTDTIGGFECVCNSGFEGDGVNCLNVDECQNGTHNCDVNSTCTDTIGGFE
ncbi:MAG: hypothetical protein JRJ47_15165, partial [Deltaproteobacteria bacterium]|nr:hypothetical protein [Deltaproteobacteria bacterium]